jgi:hypothetical protein
MVQVLLAVAIAIVWFRHEEFDRVVSFVAEFMMN